MPKPIKKLLVSRLPIKPIESAVVEFPGDPSVGIHSAHFNVELYIDLNVYSMTRKQQLKYLSNIKQKILDLYRLMDDENCGVMFDYEMADIP